MSEDSPLTEQPAPSVTLPPSGESPESRSVLSYSKSFFYGPLPSPEILSGYNKVCPGAAKIIIDNFDRQSKHRQDMERGELDVYSRNSGRGIWLSFIIGMTAIIGGIIIGDLYGAGVVVASIATLAGVYVLGSKKKEDNESSKQEETEKQLQIPFPPR